MEFQTPLMEPMMNGVGGGGGGGGTNFFLGFNENIIATARPSTPSRSSRISMINHFDDYRLLQDNLFPPPLMQKNPNHPNINNNNNHHGGVEDFWTKTLEATADETEDDNDYDYENILRDETIPQPQQIYHHHHHQQNNDHNFNYQLLQQQQQQQQPKNEDNVTGNIGRPFCPENSFLSRSCPPTSTTSSPSSTGVQQPFGSPSLIDSVAGGLSPTTTFEHDHHLLSSSPPTQQQFQCQWLDCNGIFSTICQLAEHVELGHIEQQRRYHQTSTLQTSPNHYVCLWKDCQREMKPFDQRYKLRNHLRLHTGEKPKKCEFEGCNRSFSRQENLRIHMRSHTNERPYCCRFCPKAFRNSSDKAKHIRTHDNPRPCVCNYLNCNKRYTDPSSLRKHKKNHHPEELCQKRGFHSMDYNGLSRSWSAESSAYTAGNDHDGTSVERLNQNLGKTWSNYVFNQFNTNQLDPTDLALIWPTNQNNCHNNDNQWIGNDVSGQSMDTNGDSSSFGGQHQYQQSSSSAAEAFNMANPNNNGSLPANLNGGVVLSEDDDHLCLADFLSNHLRVGS